MDKNRINKEMKELETKLHYHFRNISHLAKAMGSIKINVSQQGKTHSEHSNEGLATVGDTILKSIIADKFYRDGIRTKGEITAKKSEIENNTVMHRIMMDEGFIDYSYNTLHFFKDSNIKGHERVVSKKHDPYVEAIVGAVYYDSNYDTTKRWVLKWLLPLLEKYALIIKKEKELKLY